MHLIKVTMLIGPLDEAKCMLQKMKDLHKSPGELYASNHLAIDNL